MSFGGLNQYGGFVKIMGAKHFQGVWAIMGYGLSLLPYYLLLCPLDFLRHDNYHEHENYHVPTV